MEEIDEDEFERLCDLELELKNQVHVHTHETESGKISSVNEVEEIDFDDFIEETTNTKENSSVIPDNVISDNDEFKQCTGTLADELKDPTTVKKRLLEDDMYNKKSFLKRRKSNLPLVGYELDQSSKVDPDLEIIERIISHRKMLEDIGQSSSTDVKDRSFPVANIRKKCIFHTRIPDGDFQSLTTEAGKRIYLDVADERVFDVLVANAGEAVGRARLLSVPYRDLRNEAEKELLSMNSQVLSGEEQTNESRIPSESEDMSGSELWVNRYKPIHYLDLLSDEATNRTVLQWMKLWDKIVFGSESKSRRKEKAVKAKPKFISKFAPEVREEFDEMGRPQQKVVLLCGPPGLGKTTLAHIIATHAGYNVVEMNASDDRSLESFKTNLENATSMKSVFGTEKRPNCLIIDEIDGSPAASINFLVNLLQTKNLKTDASKGKKKDKLVLHRPVICICNDLYTLSLRPLRQISLVIQFPPTQAMRLAQRLLFISQKQLMKADLSVLLSLCNKTENDIRSCLAVLQFVRVTSKELKLNDLEGVSIGQKDYQRSLFTVWNDIFTLPRIKREPRSNPHVKQQQENESKRLFEKPEKPSDAAHSPISRFNHVLKVAQSCSEYDKLTLGWFENYPHLKFKHTHMEPVTAGLEWAATSDLLQKEIYHHQTWSLAAYIPLSFVAYHFLFACNTRPKLQFPTQYQEHISKLTKTKAIVDAMVGGMSAYTQIFSSRVSLVQDIIPYLLHILQPSLRPVNVQLFSQKEKDELKQLVHSMISYNLTYQQERTPEGQYTFTLEPNVEDMAHFPNLPKPRVVPYSLKQLIAREVELEKVRRAEKYFSSQPENPSAKNPIPQKMKETKAPAARGSQKTESNNKEKQPLPNHLQKLEAKKMVKVKVDNVVPKDFFGRTITLSQAQRKNPQINFLNSDVWFKFKEGYSNAVRRPIKVKDFFT